MLVVNKSIKKIVDGKEVLQPIKEYRVKYNDIERFVSSGEKLDVRDFNILHGQIKGTEDHIIKKHPGIFTQEEGLTDSQTVKEFEKQVKVLSKDLEEAKAQRDAAVANAEELREKITSMQNEATGYGTQIAGLKNEINGLKAKLKSETWPKGKDKTK